MIRKTPYKIGKTALAVALGHPDTRKISALIRKGGLVIDEDGMIGIGGVIAAARAFHERDIDEDPVKVATARHRLAKAKQEELALATQEGKLVKIAEIVERDKRLAMILRGELSLLNADLVAGLGLAPKDARRLSDENQARIDQMFNRVADKLERGGDGK